MTISAPRWDLTNVYPSLESDEFKAAIDDYKKQVAALKKFFKSKLKTSPTTITPKRYSTALLPQTSIATGQKSH